MILYPQGRSNWVAAPQNDTFLDREDRQMDEQSHAILSILQDLGLAGEPSGLAGRPSDLAGWPLGGGRMHIWTDCISSQSIGLQVFKSSCFRMLQFSNQRFLCRSRLKSASD